MFKKKKKTAKPQIQLKATAWKPFTFQIYLLSKITDYSPSPSEEFELLQAGLGKRIFTISSNMGHFEVSIISQWYYKTFVQLCVHVDVRSPSPKMTWI